jgi:hypothetical protein
MLFRVCCLAKRCGNHSSWSRLGRIFGPGKQKPCRSNFPRTQARASTGADARVRLGHEACTHTRFLAPPFTSLPTLLASLRRTPRTHAISINQALKHARARKHARASTQGARKLAKRGALARILEPAPARASKLERTKRRAGGWVVVCACGLLISTACYRCSRRRSPAALAGNGPGRVGIWPKD